MPTRNHSNSYPTSHPTPEHQPTVAAEPSVSIEVDGALLHVARAQRRQASQESNATSVGSIVPGCAVVLLHGAGSGTDVPVLAQLAELLVDAGVDVARLEMPYRVAGRRAPDRATRLDAVLRAAVAALSGAPVALAGRSMGARVACRCARDVGAAGVLALGFPLYPAGSAGRPPSAQGTMITPPLAGGRPDRGAELAGTGVPVLVVQGDRDRFGMPQPDAARGIEVHVVAGADHEFHTRARDRRNTIDAVAEAARVGAAWLVGRLAAAAARESAEAARGYDSSTRSTAEVR
jgi:predicted alpha/beta-hydrolase family hydrolase